MDKLINYLYQNFDIDNKKIINIFEKYKSNNNINDLYEIYIKKPILINPLFKNKISIYYKMNNSSNFLKLILVKII